MRSIAQPRLTLAAALITLLTATPALAVDPYASASASITSLRYRLVDLDPTDGVTPSANIIGGSAVAQATVFDAESGQYVYQASYLNDWPSESASIGDPLNNAAITSNSLKTSTAIDGNNPPETRSYTWGSSDQNHTKNYSQGTTLYGQATTGPEGESTLLIELSANTGIVFEGTVKTDVLINPQSLELFRQATLADAGPNATEFYSSGSWWATAGVDIHLYSVTPNPHVGVEGNTMRTSEYRLGQSVEANDVNLDDVTLQRSHTEDFKLDFWNAEATSTSVHFQFSAHTNVSSYLSTQYEVAGPIPEPGTWALMGLGLVGVALARRRQAR